MRRLSPTTALAARVGTISLILALVYYTTKSQSAKVQITSLTRETQLCNHESCATTTQIGPHLTREKHGQQDLLVLEDDVQPEDNDRAGAVTSARQPPPGHVPVGQARIDQVLRQVKNRMSERLKPRVFSAQETKLRRWAWRDGQAVPHDSLERVIGQLDDYQVQMLDWIRATRPRRQAGQGVGLGQRAGLIAEIDGGLIGDGWPTWVYSSGSRDKTEALQREQTTGIIAGSTVCSAHLQQSLKEYASLHNQMITGQVPPSYFESYIPSNEPSGGLADRLLGTSSAALYAILTRRALVVHWDNPIPFDLLFDSPLGIDWSFPYFPASEEQHEFFGQSNNIKDRLKIYGMQWKREQLDSLFSKSKWFDLSTRWIRLMLNRGVVIRSFEYPTIGDRIRDFGFEPETAFSCLMQSFFRPRPLALDFITQYTSLLALPAVFSIGIQIRTGDASMKDAALDQELNTVDRHLAFFTCAAALASRHAQPRQQIVYYLVSDSAALKRAALEAFPDRVIVSGLDPRHTDPKLKIGLSGVGGAGPTRSEKEKWMMDAMGDAVVEAWTLAETDYKVITEQSGFGKIAAFLRGQEDRTITIYPEYDDDIQESWRRAPGRESLDCSSDEALVSFKTLADQWSLG